MYFWVGVIVAVVSLSLSVLSLNPMWLLLLLVSAWCAYQEKTIRDIREEERQDRLQRDQERRLALEKRIKRYSDADWIDTFSRERSNKRSTLVTSIPPTNPTMDPTFTYMAYDSFVSASTDNDDKCRTTHVESGGSSNTDTGSSSSYDSSSSIFD